VTDGKQFTRLLFVGKLGVHLADIDQQAKAMFSRLVQQMAKREGTTERVKAKNQIAWAGAMNNIRSIADIVPRIDFPINCREPEYSKGHRRCGKNLD
jgi:hypothetical protein